MRAALIALVLGLAGAVLVLVWAESDNVMPARAGEVRT